MCLYKDASLFAMISFGLTIVAFLLNMFGFYTSLWATQTFMHPAPNDITATWSFGLWKDCYSTTWFFRCYDVKDIGWLKATQAFEVLGFIAAVVALILIILYIFVPATSGKRIVFILSILACFAAAGCILLGIIIYGSEVKHNLSWSFALCCIAGIIFAISGLLLVVDMCKR
ncbi:uncharacterized protein LOC127848086 isoform X2 [Dreissena polymorpha]|uniref:uncharacterized protein LOC127848086 isoform X2 n=1 Tax=Dreissena polymorpha TaxID=45954 RepID=UPI002263AD56|nr:uncharacterized protein LOC127848086 isoform X2 [Dreissena polymorpha]